MTRATATPGRHRLWQFNGHSAAFTHQASDDAWTATEAGNGMDFSAGFGFGPCAHFVLSQDQ